MPAEATGRPRFVRAGPGLLKDGNIKTPIVRASYGCMSLLAVGEERGREGYPGYTRRLLSTMRSMLRPCSCMVTQASHLTLEIVLKSCVKQVVL